MGKNGPLAVHVEYLNRFFIFVVENCVQRLIYQFFIILIVFSNIILPITGVVTSSYFAEFETLKKKTEMSKRSV